jgi:hypothetical protein
MWQEKGNTNKVLGQNPSIIIIIIITSELHVLEFELCIKGS